MSRSEGLVQRRNVAQSCVSTTSDPDNDNQINDTEEADLDSKETRLTLMEEILLLGLKDREVGFALWLVHIMICYAYKYNLAHCGKCNQTSRFSEECAHDSKCNRRESMNPIASGTASPSAMPVSVSLSSVT